MKLKKSKEKKCPCGRIITHPNNKTGLCPKCQKKAGGAAAGAGAQAGPTPEAGPAPDGFQGDDVVDGDYKEV